jgi:hypothetical protein
MGLSPASFYSSWLTFFAGLADLLLENTANGWSKEAGAGKNQSPEQTGQAFITWRIVKK